MATFKVVVRKKRTDGFYPVYIRVVHRSRIPPRTRRMTSWQVQSVRFVKCQTPCFPEAHRVFTRNDFVLKISDKANPSNLIIANNLKKEQIVGSLNALVLNPLDYKSKFKGRNHNFTTTNDNLLNHFDIEQAEEFKITKYLCKTHFNMKKIKDEKSIMFLCPKSMS